LKENKVSRSVRNNMNGVDEKERFRLELKIIEAMEVEIKQIGKLSDETMESLQDLSVRRPDLLERINELWRKNGQYH